MKNVTCKLSVIVLLMALFMSNGAQSQEIMVLGAETDGTVVNTNREIDDFGFTILDDGGDANEYSIGTYSLTIKNMEACSDNSAFGIKVSMVDLSPYDELIIYDGASTSSNVLFRAKGDTLRTRGHVMLAAELGYTDLIVFSSDTNSCDCMTVQIKSVYGGHGEYLGFVVNPTCYRICERVTPVIETIFTKTRDGVPYDQKSFSPIYVIDTVFEMVYDSILGDSIASSTIIRIDTLGVSNGVFICEGDGLILHGRGSYTNLTGRYTPRDETSIFEWKWGNGVTWTDTGMTDPEYIYHDIQCYDVSLSITDTMGCSSTVSADVQVRIAQNPIKTIFSLANTCNTDSLQVNIGYDGDNATMTLRQIEYSKTVSKINQIRVFIPDGTCTHPDGSQSACYEAPVLFTEFPAGRKIMKGEDICSICINYEHEYMGDYRISIICPTGQEAIIKYATTGHDPVLSGGSGSWYLVNDQPVSLGTTPPNAIPLSHGNIYTGVPYGGDNHHTYDTGDKCDSLTNPYGVGFDYCFSRNKDYTLVTGKPANTDSPEYADYIFCSTAYMDTVTMDMDPIPAGYSQAGQTATVTNCRNVKMQSDYENKKDYYLPVSDFSSLIGCPLNGEWSIRLCDWFGSDNGWVFNWSMDICKLNSGSSCEYQVGIDSVVWYPDPADRYHDYELGHYRGLEVHKRDETRSFLLTPDTAGTFPIVVNVHDQFGCIWDTTTKITTVWTPTPKLGNDTLLCSIESIVLDASDRHADICNYSYVWEPNGQDSDTIHTATGTLGETYYISEVTNKQHNIRCTMRDTIIVRVNKQPVPNFDPGVYPLEGCAPYTVDFHNTSTDGHHYLWVFGDGVTSNEESPTHSFAEGTFDFKYYIYSQDGCVDSLIYPNLVTVYPNPVTAFSWTPTYPTVLSPNVQPILQLV